MKNAIAILLSLIVNAGCFATEADSGTRAESELKSEAGDKHESQTPSEEETHPAPTPIAKEVKKVEEAISNSRSRREDSTYSLGLIYSPFDLIIPSKIGGSLGWIRDGNKIWELEYLRGSISVPFMIKDLGELTDERLTLMARSFSGNSFNFSYGLTYFRFQIHLGSEILNRVSGSYPSIDVLSLEALGTHLGIGNHWALGKNITLGIDWVSWSQPIIITKKRADFLDYATNTEDYDNANKALNIISRFPRFAFLKLQLGIMW